MAESPPEQVDLFFREARRRKDREGFRWQEELAECRKVLASTKNPR